MIDDKFDQWVDQWEKALKDGVFDGAPKPAIPKPESFFGLYNNASTESEIKDVDAAYWNHVYKLSNNSGEAPDPLESLNEAELSLKKPQKSHPTDFTLVQTTESDGLTTAEITDKLGGLPNRVQPSTRGVDKRNHVTPNWSGGEQIQELHDLKVQLEKVESEFNAAEANGNVKKMKSLVEKMDGLSKKLDKLSNELTPDFRTEYLS
jgi:hypothetical protein